MRYNTCPKCLKIIDVRVGAIICACECGADYHIPYLVGYWSGYHDCRCGGTDKMYAEDATWVDIEEGDVGNEHF